MIIHEQQAEGVVHAAFRLIRDAGAVDVTCTMLSTGRFYWFTDPRTRSTLAMYEHEIRTTADVRAKLERHRAKWSEANA